MQQELCTAPGANLSERKALIQVRKPFFIRGRVQATVVSSNYNVIGMGHADADTYAAQSEYTLNPKNESACPLVSRA